MNRKKFLVYVGFMLFSLLGITSIIKKISDTESFRLHKNTAEGFGSDGYGGKENK